MSICIPAQKDKAHNSWKIKGGGLKTGGEYGMVLQVCRDNDCNYIIKIIHMNEFSYPKVFNREVCFQRVCAENGLCKPVEDWWLCDDGETGVIITPILKQTLREEMRWDLPLQDILPWVKKGFRLIHDLHKLGIVHGSAHLANIMSDNNGDLFFIDMGVSQIIDDQVNGSVKWDYIMRDYDRFFKDMGRHINRAFLPIIEKYKNEYIPGSVENKNLRRLERIFINEIEKITI